MLLVASLGLPGSGAWADAVPALLMIALGLFGVAVRRTPDALVWVGAAALSAAWIGLPAAALLGLSAGETGGRTLLFLLTTVMVGEAGAYVGGKLVGGPRLARSVSPGKTWAGFVAQLLVGGLAALATAPLLFPGPGVWTSFLLGGWLSAAAALGDLFESRWKRASGRKDSGNLIPGHGGVLDRVDGILFAALALAAVGSV